jgi:signal peptide peptidase SppA
MNSIQLISAILKGKWLVEPHFAISQGSVIASVLNKESQILKSETDLMSAFAVSSKTVTGTRHSYYHGFDKASPGSVAVISLKGALMKADQYCGPSGMSAIGNIIKAADSHHNIDAIVLHIDSPGGTVDGTESLANIIKATDKPIVSFVDGLMASAALWVGTSADEIIASTDTDEIGSVGVLMSFMDIQAYWEKLGVKFHTITASTSPEKVKMWEDLRDGKYEEYIKDVLDPLDQKFMNTIRENCPNVEDKHLTGKTFFARDVMGVFVDSIGTLDDAILRAAQLADENSGSNSNSNTTSMKQFTKVNSALGVETLESTDDSVSLNGDQLQVIETALEETDAVQGQLDTANENLTAAESERDTANTALETATTAFDSIDETIASAATPEEKATAVRALLSAKPGANAEGAKEKEDETVDADANWEAIDNLPHNQNVD